MQASGEIVYRVNETVIALVVVGSLLLAVELGYRLGGKFPPGLTDSAKSPVLAVSGALLGLLALLLGFTLSMSLDRFEDRRQLVVQEANAIGTTYLRSGLLPEPDRSAVAELLRSYVEARLDFFNRRDDEAEFKRVIDRNEKLQRELWSHVATAVEKDSRPVTTGLFIQTLNEVIDLHEARVAAMENHVPESVLLLLLLVAVLAAMLVGYGCGLANRRHLLSTSVLSLLIGAVVIVIMDLDRPNRGLIHVSQKSMVRLRESMKSGAP
jgi:hypothetical protein